MPLEPLLRQTTQINPSVTPSDAGSNVAQGISQFEQPFIKMDLTDEQQALTAQAATDAYQGKDPAGMLNNLGTGAKDVYQEAYSNAAVDKANRDFQTQQDTWLNQLMMSDDRESAWSGINQQASAWTTNYTKNMPSVIGQNVNNQLSLNVQGMQANARQLMVKQNTDQLHFNLLQGMQARVNGAYQIGFTNNRDTAQAYTQQTDQSLGYLVKVGALSPAQAAEYTKQVDEQMKYGSLVSSLKNTPPDQWNGILNTFTATSSNEQMAKNGIYMAKMLNEQTRLQNSVNSAAIDQVTQQAKQQALTTGMVDPSTMAQLSTVSSGQKAQSLTADMQFYADAGKQVNAASTAPYSQLPSVISNLKQQQTFAGEGDKGKYTDAIKYAQGQLDTAQKDPAQFIMGNPSWTQTYGQDATESQFNQFIQSPTNPQDNANAVQVHMGHMVQLQKSIGIPESNINVLSNDQAKSIVGQYNQYANSTTPDSAYYYLYNLLNASGDYSDMLTKSLEKNGLPSVVSVVAKGYPSNSPWLTGIQQAFQPDNMKADKSAIVQSGFSMGKDIMPAVDNVMSDYKNTYSGLQMDRSGIEGETAVVQQYAAHLLASNEASTPKQAANLAYTRLISNRYTDVSGDLRIPIQYQQYKGDLVNSVMPYMYNQLNQQIQSGTVKSQLELSLSPQAAANISKISNLKDARWAMYNDNTVSAVDGDGYPLVDTKTNKPIEFSFNDLPDLIAKAQSQPKLPTPNSYGFMNVGRKQ